MHHLDLLELHLEKMSAEESGNMHLYLAKQEKMLDHVTTSNGSASKADVNLPLPSIPETAISASDPQHPAVGELQTEKDVQVKARCATDEHDNGTVQSQQ